MDRGNVFSLNGKIETECLSVVGAQYAPIGAVSMTDVDRNLNTLLNFMDRASGAFPGTDLIVAPEACLQGFPQSGWENALLTLEAQQVKALCEKCAELEMWGVFAFLLKSELPGAFTNTAVLVDDKGKIRHTYDKMNPWIPFETSLPGESCTVYDGPKGAKIGLIICADGDYPEIWREAAVNGANVIIRPTHYMDPWQNAWEITNKAGAYFNQVYVVAVNASGTAENENYSCFGRSMILGPDGNIICEGGNGVPSMIKANLYPGIIDAMRKQAVHSAPMYSYDHRGASSRKYAGTGRGTEDYRSYAGTDQEVGSGQIDTKGEQ